MSSFEDLIKKQLGDSAPEEATELELNHPGGVSEDIPPAIAKMTALKSLSLNGIRLTSLAKLPVLPKLQKLDLSDNELEGGLEHLVWVGGTPGGAVKLPNLRRLALSNNKVGSVDALRPLAALKGLSWLDLDPNPVSKDSAEYNKGAGVRAIVPGLEVVDGLDKDGEEADEEDDEEEEEDGESESEGDWSEDEESDDDGDAALGLSALLGDIKDSDEDDDFDPGLPPGDDYDNDSNLEDNITDRTLDTHIAKSREAAKEAAASSSSSGSKRKLGEGEEDDGAAQEGLNPSDLFGGAGSGAGLGDNDDTRTKRQRN